jgi:hypothetical protein
MMIVFLCPISSLSDPATWHNLCSLETKIQMLWSQLQYGMLFTTYVIIGPINTPYLNHHLHYIVCEMLSHIV